MIKKNLWKYILSSALTLLPILYLIPLAEQSEIVRMSFGWSFVIIPIVTCLINIALLVIESIQYRKYEQSPKITNLTYWIIPSISIYVSTMFFALAMGFELSVSVLTAPLLGVIYIVMGNYMPKARQNRTFGIKIKWTLENEENWNATHRFAGKLWVGLGILMLLTAFLPDIAFTICFIVILTVSVVAVTLYSYLYHKKQIKEGGSEVTSTAFTKGDKKATIIALIGGAVFLLIIAVLMFVGKLNFTCEAEKLVIDTSFGGGMEINYDDIESVDFVESSPSGSRISGFGSARLLFGWFKNDVYGNYIRYTYSGSECYILMIVDGEEVVIADVNYESTKALYDALVERTK